MFESEIQKAIYIGVDLFLVAIVLTFFSMGLRLRNDYADVRNDQIVNEMEMQDYREFSKYDMDDYTGDSSKDKSIYGNEAIELIRNYHDSSKITIWVDMLGSSDSSKRGVYVFGNLAKEYKDFGTSPNTGNIKDCDGSYKALQTLISPRNEFHTYIVYNSNNPDYVNKRVDKGNGSEVTAVKVILTKENK